MCACRHIYHHAQALVKIISGATAVCAILVALDHWFGAAAAGKHRMSVFPCAAAHAGNVAPTHSLWPLVGRIDARRC